MNAIVLKPIDRGNILCAFDLKLEEGQKIFVSHPMRSLALGYVYHDICRPFGIYNGGRMIGYIMLRFEVETDSCVIWHFMIDREHQGHGCGAAALSAALDYIRSAGNYRQVLLTCHPKNEAALKLYQRFGFMETGRVEGVENELKLTLFE